MKFATLCCCLTVALTSAAQEPRPDIPLLSYEFVDKSLVIRYDERTLFTYVYEDNNIPRPYFANVYTLEGRRLTRPHPAPDGPNNDHPTFHPGIWLSFGDLNGEDFWRNKARTRGAKPVIVETDQSVLHFTASATFEAENGDKLGVLDLLCGISVGKSHYSILLRYKFRPLNGSLVFGDQEEMGLGIRLDTPLTVEFGAGTIQNAEDGINEYGTWGIASSWCTYAAEIDDRKFGVTLRPSSRNLRPSWFHTRDYGLLVANPFGRNAMTGGPKSRVEVNQLDSFKLGFDVFVIDAPAEKWPSLHPNYPILYYDAR